MPCSEFEMDTSLGQIYFHYMRTRLGLEASVVFVLMRGETWMYLMALGRPILCWDGRLVGRGIQWGAVEVLPREGAGQLGQRQHHACTVQCKQEEKGEDNV